MINTVLLEKHASLLKEGEENQIELKKLLAYYYQKTLLRLKNPYLEIPAVTKVFNPKDIFAQDGRYGLEFMFDENFSNHIFSNAQPVNDVPAQIFSTHHLTRQTRENEINKELGKRMTPITINELWVALKNLVFQKPREGTGDLDNMERINLWLVQYDEYSKSIVRAHTQHSHLKKWKFELLHGTSELYTGLIFIKEHSKILEPV